MNSIVYKGFLIINYSAQIGKGDPEYKKWVPGYSTIGKTNQNVFSYKRFVHERKVFAIRTDAINYAYQLTKAEIDNDFSRCEENSESIECSISTPPSCPS
jgi:hypothetical protein